ncbi:DCC-interacting protein 13-alpha [Elysia marginata]|uniref:DCC-interacting protein 13-alpha n=1 Tax=Elysia marginata TaxID=1093978 RepID=A0AAV4H8K4_9GAST|nr:DCC-interacting protein 13-alpha [Elysia marginata]
MEVKGDRGEQLVHSTIRQIMAARAIHNIFKMSESLMVVTSEGMRLIDPSNNVVRVEFALQDISFWSSHPDNNRLFGFITRSRPPTAKSGSPSSEQEQNSGPTFACHVFECNTTAEDICQAISTSTKIAYQALMERRRAQASGKTQVPVTAAAAPRQRAPASETSLLLQNIQALSAHTASQPDDTATHTTKQSSSSSHGSLLDMHDDADDDSCLPLSSDGKFLILSPTSEESSEDKGQASLGGEEEESNA